LFDNLTATATLVKVCTFMFCYGILRIKCFDVLSLLTLETAIRTGNPCHDYILWSTSSCL